MKGKRGAAFCASCGAPLPPVSPSGYSEGNRSAWIGAAISAAALIVALLGLSASGVLRFGAPKTTPSLPAIADKPKPTLQVPKDPEVAMPDDIRAWLEHLERIEKRRVSLAKEQIRMLMIDSSEFQATAYADTLKALLGEDPTTGEIPPEYDSRKKAEKIVDSVRPDWKDLAVEFEAMPPPAECQAMAAKYSQVLRETGATTGDIIDTMYSSGGDPSTTIDKLQEIMKSHQQQIDKPAIEVDHAVQDICDKYNTRKWFDIHGDVGGGGLFSSPNLPGLGGSIGGLGG